MRIAAMEVECDSRIAQLQAAHEQKIRELTSDAESEGLAKLEAHRSLLARLTAVQKEAASLKFCHVQLVETRGECEALKQEMAGVVTRVTGACAKQEATIAEQQWRSACEWLRNHKNVWEPWVKCPTGEFEYTDENGEHGRTEGEHGRTDDQQRTPGSSCTWGRDLRV